MVTFLALLMVVGVALSAMAPEARVRLREVVLESVEQVRREAARGRPRCDEFREALRARTRWAVVTPALIALNVIVLILMMSGAGTPGDPGPLAGWGGNFWLRTRNGEWWRLVTSMFVHAGPLHLLVVVAGLLQIGLILERLVGRLIVVAVFLIAGVLAGVVHLATHPMATSVGASGAVFGLYGLLLAASIWGMRHRSNVTIPLPVVKRLAPAAAVFILYNLANDSVGAAAELAGFLAGLVCGTVLAKGVSDCKPAARRVAHLTAAAVAIVVLIAIPLRGVADVMPELDRTVADEDWLAGEYQEAADLFRSDKMTAEALAPMISRSARSFPSCRPRAHASKRLRESPRNINRWSRTPVSTCGCGPRAGACGPSGCARRVWSRAVEPKPPSTGPTTARLHGPRKNDELSRGPRAEPVGQRQMISPRFLVLGFRLGPGSWSSLVLGPSCA